MNNADHPSKELTLPIGLRILRKFTFPRKLGALERIYGNMLSKHGVQRVTLANGIRWKLDLSDASHRWMIYGDYEGPEQMNWMRRQLSEGGVFVDSGANIGQMVAYLSHLSGVITFAFEPVKQEREWLAESLQNYASWKTHIIPFGLSDHQGQAEIQRAGGKSTLRQDWYTAKNFGRETISLTTLDRFCFENQIKSIKLWKLDVEGHEPEAIRGAAQLLSKKLIDSLLIECQSSTIPAIIDILNSYQYQLHILKGEVLTPIHEYDYNEGFFGNLIALPLPDSLAGAKI